MSPLGGIGAIGDRDLCAHTHVDWPRPYGSALTDEEPRGLTRLLGELKKGDYIECPKMEKI